MTAFMFASSNGYTEVVELLLNRGVDPNIRNDDGETALMIASGYRHTEIVELLERHFDDIFEIDVFDIPSSPDKQQLRNEAARNIQRRMRGNRQRRKLTKKSPKYGKMASPTTDREKMRRWTDLTRMYLDDPIKGYEQFSIYPETLLPGQTEQIGGYRMRTRRKRYRYRYY